MSFEVKSPMAGKVWKVEAKVGDVVEEISKIMILESMKMEIPVVAGGAGTVSKIVAEIGQVVEQGQVLAVLD